MSVKPRVDFFFVKKKKKPGSLRSPNKQNKEEKCQPISQTYKKLIRENYEQFYANKIGRPREMDKFLDIYSLPELNQEEINNLNRLITSSKVESVIKKHLANRSPGLDDFIREFYQTYIEEVIHTFLKLFQKTEEERTTKFIL